MKKIVCCIIFSFLFFTGCDLIFGTDDDSEKDAPVIISPKPKVSFDSSGNAISVWHLYDGSKNKIWASRYDISTSKWDTTGIFKRDESGDAINPQLAVNDSGKAITVWEQTDKNKWEEKVNIWACAWSDGTGWGTAEKIGTDENGDTSSPDIAIDSSGTALAVWSQSNGTSSHIYSSLFTDSAWGSAEPVESNSSNNYTPHIKFYSPGNALVLWNQDGEENDSIFSNTYISGTGWSLEEQIGQDEVDRTYEPQVVLDPSGNIVLMAVWGRFENEIWEIYSNKLTAGFEWNTAVPISNIASSGEFDPQIAFDGSGNAIAAWRHYDGENYIINANKYDNVSGWGSEIETISSTGPVRAFDPQVASDSSGNAIVVWHQVEEEKWEIYANRYSPTSGWIGSEVLGSHESENLKNPFIAFDSSGNAIVVWNRNNDSIWAKRFNGTSWEDAVQISIDE